MAPELTEIENRTPSEISQLLQRPFHQDAIKQRRVGGGMVNYVSIDDVVDRLNRAALQWQWHVERIEYVTLPLRRRDATVDALVAQVVGTLSIPGLGSRQGIGTSPCEGNEDSAKAAESDAIKRAASLFGVPMEGK